MAFEVRCAPDRPDLCMVIRQCRKSHGRASGGSVRVLPTFPVTQRHAVNRRNRGAGPSAGPVRLVCRTPPSVAGRGAYSSLRILRSLPACSRRERNWRSPPASDGASATRPPTARNPSELPAAPGAPGGRRACCAARALGRFFQCDALAVLVAGFPVDGEISWQAAGSRDRVTRQGHFSVACLSGKWPRALIPRQVRPGNSGQISPASQGSAGHHPPDPVPRK
jgi:hypothetical protein